MRAIRSCISQISAFDDGYTSSSVINRTIIGVEERSMATLVSDVEIAEKIRAARLLPETYFGLHCETHSDSVVGEAHTANRTAHA